MLFAFLVTTSGWVLHSHYCPESHKQVYSLLNNAQCAEPVRTEPLACCSKPEPIPVPVCGTDEDCCEDVLIVLELPGPYSAPVFQSSFGLQDDFFTLYAFSIAFAPVYIPVSRQPEHPIPPPLRRSLDRLNMLQVYRT